MRDVDEGRFYLPDAEEGERETLITSSIDAEPEQCLRVAGPSFLPLIAAVFTGGAFIFPTFHMYAATLISAALALGAILAWLWTGTAIIPEKPEKDVGLGLRLPLYVSGPRSVGWWAMFITMLGDMTAFLSLVFGYFFYWTVHADFPPDGFARARPVLAAPRPGPAARGVAFDPSGARLEQARAGTGDAGSASGGSRRSPASVARRCWRAPGSTGSTRPRMSIPRSCGSS